MPLDKQMKRVYDVIAFHKSNHEKMEKMWIKERQYELAAEHADKAEALEGVMRLFEDEEFLKYQESIIQKTLKKGD